MGASFSSKVDFKVPLRNKHICTKTGHYYRCSPKSNSQARQLELQKEKVESPYYGSVKPPNRTRAPSPASNEVPSALSVLIVSGDEDSDEELEIGRRRRNHTKACIRNFSRDFEDPQAHLEDSLEQVRKEDEIIHNFVRAWKNGLTSYPHERIEKVCSDIPVAATTQCKQGISRCRRCHRFCLRCTSAEASEHLLDDLLHKESLDRFMYDNEYEHIASSIVIRQNLKLKRLYESVKHPSEDQQAIAQEGEVPVDDEDLTISIHFNIPPPVHLEHPVPDDLIRLPPPEILHKKYDKHHQKEADILEHDMLTKVHPEHHPQFSLDGIVDKLRHHHPASEMGGSSMGSIASSRRTVKTVKKSLHFNLEGIIDKIKQHVHRNDEQHQNQNQNNDDQPRDQYHHHSDSDDEDQQHQPHNTGSLHSHTSNADSQLPPHEHDDNKDDKEHHPNHKDQHHPRKNNQQHDNKNDEQHKK